MLLGAGSRRASPLLCSAARVGRASLPRTRYRTTQPVPRTTTTTRRPCSGGRSKPETKPPPTGPSASAKEPAPRASLFSVFLGRYTALLESRPLATKAITSGVIAFGGDISCQLISVQIAKGEDYAEEHQHELGLASPPPNKVSFVAADIDWGRCARFTFLGAAFLAPALHYWYGFLIRTLPGTAVFTVVKRVALDQLVFTPVFLASFLSTIMVLDGNAAKITQKLRADYTTTLVGNWGYWIPGQIINFRFVGPVYQVLFANCLGFFWNVYLSYQSNKAVEDSAAGPLAPDGKHLTSNESE